MSHDANICLRRVHVCSLHKNSPRDAKSPPLQWQLIPKALSASIFLASDSISKPSGTSISATNFVPSFLNVTSCPSPVVCLISDIVVFSIVNIFYAQYRPPNDVINTAYALDR